LGGVSSPTTSSGAIVRTNIDLQGAALALLISVFWGINPALIKIALADIAPIRLAAVRFLLGGATIALWAWWSGRLAGFRIAPGEARPLVVVSTMLGIQVALMNYGTNITSAAHSAIILNSYAVHIVALAHFLIPGDRLSPRRLTGILIAYAGIVLLFARRAPGGDSTFLGDLLIFVSSVLLAERTVYLASAVHRLDPVKLLLAQTVIGCFVFSLYAAIAEPGPTNWTVGLAGIVLFQGVVLAGFNFVVNLWLLGRYRPSALAAFFLTQPIFGVVAAALLTRDALTAELIVASAAVTVGIWLTSR
jgi:drug/metabolite transporter (DMT)-like permease